MKGFDPREPAPFALLVLLAFVVARFLGVAAHEALGHGAFAVAVGGSFYGAYVSPGAGFAMVYVPPEVPPALNAAVALAGVLVELVLGLLLWRSYPRAATFLGRLFLLVLLEVFLVYALVYLAVGALEGTGGDPSGAAAILRAPHLVPAFLFVGIAWAAAFAFRISRELVRLVAPASAGRRQTLYLSLFWFTPFAAGVVPGLVFSDSLSASLFLYFLLFLGVGGAAFGVAAYLASRVAGSPGPAPERPVGRALPVAVAFAFVLPAWLLPFGPTDGTAHGVLFAEPPLEAEPYWANPIAVNVLARVDGNLRVTLEFRFKGMPQPRSPVEQAVVDSYEDRADFAYWSDGALQLAAAMTSVDAWRVVSAEIEANGVAWAAGASLPRPRLVVVAPERAEDHARLVAVVRNETPRYVRLTLWDPWRYDPGSECPECHLDEVNVTWPDGGPLRLVRIVQRDGYAERLSGVDADSGTRFARFRNRAADLAPKAWDVLWEWA